MCKSVDVCKTKNLDLFNKVYIFEPMKGHIYETNINQISLISLMFNYTKPQLLYITFHFDISSNKTWYQMLQSLCCYLASRSFICICSVAHLSR